MMRRIVVGIFLAGALLAAPAPLLAQRYGLTEVVKEAKLPTRVAGQGTVEGVIGAMIQVGLSMLGIVFFGLIFYAGIRWMTARGNTEAVDKAKETLESAAIGLVLVLAAYAITRFVLTALITGEAEVSSDAATANVCDTADDGAACGDNKVCAGGLCISECVAQGGACMNPDACTAGTKKPGLCPGAADNVCCISS